MKQPTKRSAKKVYQPPKLLVYGDLAEMTKAIGNKFKIDGGANPRHRRTGR
ncbi:MAG TPA: hypothetical protein VK805_03600 [Candidatus Baltobacteraceae bacterium]|nr:hypothetical protein [Candidatus Baltobacteraceae bacterium]